MMLTIIMIMIAVMMISIMMVMMTTITMVAMDVTIHICICLRHNRSYIFRTQSWIHSVWSMSAYRISTVLNPNPNCKRHLILWLITQSDLNMVCHRAVTTCTSFCEDYSSWLLTLTTVIAQHISLSTVCAFTRSNAVCTKYNIGTPGWINKTISLLSHVIKQSELLQNWILGHEAEIK